MTKLEWGLDGTRYYELGVDRGVLYPVGKPGVAWSGLISVSESPDGGEAIPYYLDGFKYLNMSARTEYQATIEALSAPREFDECDGRRQIAPGLVADQQVRRPFSFSYRNLIGNDVSGSELGYKTHLVYNALAKPAQRKHETLSQGGSPSSISWEITTLPIALDTSMGVRYRPSAHLILDSRHIHPLLMAIVNANLYGTSGTVSTLLRPDQIANILNTTISTEVLIAWTSGALVDVEAFWPAHHGSAPPSNLSPGQKVFWFDQSSGFPSTLRFATGV